MPQIFIKPKVQGHIIRHPEKRKHIISQEGEWVEDSYEWQRKLIQGDIVECPPPSEEISEKASPKSKSNKGAE